MNDDRVWVPVEVIWDDDLRGDNPWRGDPRGRGVRSADRSRAGSLSGWSQGWLDDEEELPEEEWDIAKHFQQDGAGLSKRKRKKLRAQDRDAER
jgi:hypothetical protein